MVQESELLKLGLPSSTDSQQHMQVQGETLLLNSSFILSLSSFATENMKAVHWRGKKSVNVCIPALQQAVIF